VTCPTGGSQKTVIGIALKCMSAITQRIATETGATANSLLGRGKRSSLEPSAAEPCSRGENSSRTTRKRVYVAPSSETRATRSGLHSLSNRLTQSLISAGLVKGTIPMSIRKQSRAGILATVFDVPDGGAVGLHQEDFLFSSVALGPKLGTMQKLQKQGNSRNA
jgi:hypothetical protein